MRALAIALALAATPAAAQTLAVTHAEAWTMEGGEPVRDATIVIENGHVLSVMAGGRIPAGAIVIDAQGKPVTPGFVNGATQVGLIEVRSAAETRDNSSADDRNPGFNPARALNGNSTLVSLARADGVTRALVYPSPSRHPVFSGEPVMARLREGVDIIDRSGIAVYATIGGGEWDKLGSRAQQWTVLRKALTDAKRLMAPRDAEQNSGKQHDRRSPSPNSGNPGPSGKDLLGAVVAGQVPLAIETNRESDILQAIAIARDYDIRVVIVGGGDAWRVADALAAAKIGVVLDPQANLPFSFDQLSTRQDAAAILTRAGVPVAIGLAGGSIHMNYNAGLALREGAGIAVANGLPYLDGLRAVTVNPLAIWGRGGGTLAPGSDADLVVWDGDPLEPSTNAVAVVIEGKQVSTRSRQDLLAERYKDARP